MKLDENFFNRSVLNVAPDLLGKYLVRKNGRAVTAAQIIEVEAYNGTDDLACHASKGLTPRTRVLFGLPGHTYVYLIYGMYHCLNFVCDRQGYPAAVLIRAVAVPGADGPGKLCRVLNITREHNDLPPDNGQVWVEDRGAPAGRIITTPRIGVEYAGPWARKPWRFVLQ